MGGVVAVMVVLLTTVTPVAAVPPKATVAPETKLVPVMVTLVPPVVGPEVGEIEETVGAAMDISERHTSSTTSSDTEQSDFIGSS